MTASLIVGERPLPVVLPPARDELLSSWLRRHVAFYGVLAAARIRAYPAALGVLTNEHSLQEHAQCRHEPISADDSGGTIDPCKRWPLATASGGLRR